MKKCPLCAKELLFDVLTQSYFCETQYTVEANLNSHYRDNPPKYVILPYKLLHYAISKEFLLSKLIPKNNHFPAHWKSIMMIKDFEIKSEEQLRNKIKTILVFQ